MANSTNHPANVRSIEVRNLRFPQANTPKYWLGGQRSVSMFFDHLSILFPPGEAFFMNSVRAFEPQLADAGLRSAVRGFHAQEALHGREHTHYNERLAALGYPVAAIDRAARRRLDAGKSMSQHMQLAVTMALEHLTTVFARVLLAKDSPLCGADPELAALWRWHAAEENEHAAVAFDVFREVGGSYAVRIAIMLLTTFTFTSAVVENQIRMMWADGILHSLREWWALGRFMFAKRGLLRRMARPYLRFYRRDFHPDEDPETSALLDDWKREFASAPIYRDNLYSRAAQ